MPAREPSMEDILASIKRVIAEEKEIRASAPPPEAEGGEEDVAGNDESELDPGEQQCIHAGSPRRVGCAAAGYCAPPPRRCAT